MISYLPVELIDPSPYQHRRHFDPAKLAELARSIQRDGLIEPIVVRPMGERYELIAGERRLRATRQATLDTILSRIVEATDAQARRMCAAENLQRDDLSPVEQVEAIVDMVDADLIEDPAYAQTANTPAERVKWLLSRLDAVDASQRRGSEIKPSALELFHKFVEQVDTLFANLPRPMNWRTFYNHDLPLVTDLDPAVREWAIAHKLNKSQAKALDKVKQASPRKFKEIVDQGGVNARDDLQDGASGEGVIIPLQEVSARELQTVAFRERGREQFLERMDRAPAPPLPPSITLEVSDARHLPLADESIDLIVTSPPYGLDVEYATYTDPAELWYDLMQQWTEEAYRVARSHARMAVNIPLDTAGPRPTYAQFVRAATLSGWRYETTIVWNEDNITRTLARGSVASPSAPHIIARVEMIAVFSKSGQPYHNETPPDLTKDEWLAWTNGLWTFRGETRAWEGHPAAFPEELPRRLIKLLSYPGDTVLDPFCGSGTTPLIAYRLGRLAIGLDIDAGYIESARRRLATVQGVAA